MKASTVMDDIRITKCEDQEMTINRQLINRINFTKIIGIYTSSFEPSKDIQTETLTR